jgi:queuine tRNA-ribosyltransferase
MRDLRSLLPAFLPDATRAGVRSVGSDDLRAAGVPALMVNIFHLLRRPGIRVIQRCGGVHRFMDWHGPIMSDSGGFQVYSLIRQNPDYGTIRPNEVIFRDPESGQKWQFSPERSIQMQFQIGSDVAVCLDDCTDATASAAELEASVDRTVRWAARGKAEFDRLVSSIREPIRKPLLVAVVQGGANLELRAQCARELVGLGFDGYGFGGWPLSPLGDLLTEELAAVAQAVPSTAIRHALGVGRPDHLVTAARLGYNSFDCSLPTRDARRGRLYVYRPGSPAALGESTFYDNLHILDERFIADRGPIDPSCDCVCCTRFSRAYVQHLLKVGDASGERLASIHNLRFYVRLLDQLRIATPPNSATWSRAPHC